MLRDRSEPIFNVPLSVIAVISAILLVHVVRQIIPEEEDIYFLVLFAFMPARFGGQFAEEAWPGGAFADVWTFVTYAALHASWLHVGVNALWLLAFGSALARRFGALRFALFTLVAAAAGAFVHLAVHFGEVVPVVGASACVSGHMAAAVRFAFQRGGPLWSAQGDDGGYKLPALPLRAAFADPRVLGFVGVWVAVNLIFGLTGLGSEGAAGIAWEAHFGGFLAGLFLFDLFDPVGRGPRSA